MTHFSDEIIDNVIDMCESVNSAKAVGIALCLKHGLHDQLLSIEIDPDRYGDSTVFAQDYMLLSYLSKYTGLQLNVDTAAVALDSWKAAELQCKSTNARFRGNLTSLSSETHRVLHSAARKISSLLGSLRYDVLCNSEWSPGATFDLQRGAGLDNKMFSDLTVTPEALPFARAYLEWDYHWFWGLTDSFPDGPYCVLDTNFTLVPGAKFATVPKNAKTDRCIAIEPTMNVFLQKSVGKFIRRRLRRVGVDLDDQAVNQHLAARAVSDHLATVDLKSASDTIATGLLRHLIPDDWFFLLDSLRSRLIRVGDEWVKTEKFSSMGNGFTFELESLVFWALASATVERLPGYSEVGVYGDDIIIPQAAFDSLALVLNECGFTLNKAKSYSSGRFFESCGKHFFDGIDVTPIYQKKQIRSRKQLLMHEVIRAHNRLVRWHLRVFGTWRGPVNRRPLSTLWGLAPKVNNGNRPAVPMDALGDDGFLRPLPYFSRVDRNGAVYCTVLIFHEKKRLTNGKAALATWVRRRRFSPEEDSSSPLQPTADSLAFSSLGMGRWRYRQRYVFTYSVDVAA